MKNRYQINDDFKEDCKSNFGTNRQGKIHVVEDDIDIIGENYDGQLVDFTIEDNCYVNDKFIGTTVSKKVTVNILNPNNSINLENKEIQAYAGINGEYVPFGNFIIQKPQNEEVKEKTSFIGYDYMIKFNTPYKNQVQYPISLINLLNNLCTQVGIELGNNDFVNSNYMVLGNPFTNNEDCRTVLSNIAQLAGGFAKIGRDNKVYIKTLKNISNLLTVKYVNAMTVKELNLTEVRVLSGNQSNADETIDGNNYFDDFSKNDQWGEVNSLVIGLSNIEGENTALEDKASIAENGLTEITINDNYFLTSQEEREKVIVPIWNSLKGLKYLPFKTKYYGYPYLDSGDIIYIKDINDNGYISYVFNHTFTFNGSFSGSIETIALTKTQTAYKNTFDVKTKFKQVERSVDKVNGTITDVVEKQTETGNKLTKVEQDINGITQTVKNVQTDLNENYSTTKQMNSAIEQSAGEINLEVSQKIDNIQVGAANLIPNSAPYNLEKYIISNTDLIELTLQDEETAPSKKCLCIRTLEQLTSTQGIYVYPTSNLKEGLQYCFSIWIRATANTNLTVGVGNYGTTAFNVTTEYQKFNYKFTATDSDIHGFAIYLPINTIAGRQIFVHSIMLEEGNQITSWSPAPEDNVNGSEIISRINMSPEEIQIDASKLSLKGKEINLTSDSIIISSNNFNVDINGNLTCNNANMNNVNISGGSVILYDNDNTSALRVYSTQNDSKHAYYASNRFSIKDDITGYQVWASMVYNTNETVIGAHLEISGEEGTTSIDDGNIKCVSLIQTSQDRYKKNFEKLNNALEIINNIDIYKYNLKYEKDTDKKHIGFVIGKKYKYRKEVTNKDNTGAEIYSLASLNTAGIKELNNRLQKIEKILEVT